MHRTLSLLAVLALGAGCDSVSRTGDARAGATATISMEEGTMREIDIHGFKADLDAGRVQALYDVRTPAEYAEGHVPGTTLVPLQELQAREAEFEGDKDKTIYLICRSGGRSGQAAQYLASKGYDVVNIQGGTSAWIQAGHPVER
jgi:rhodanese-related sulfurtransferase